MANPEHVEIVRRGAEAIRSWQKSHPHVQFDLTSAELNSVDISNANLSRADFRQATLQNAKLRNANLNGATLSLADLTSADLYLANLRGVQFFAAILARASFREANLAGSNFAGADLSGASFEGANLFGVNLFGTDLSNAVFSKAVCFNTIFVNVDLSVAVQLEEAVHNGPSSVGIDTLYKSRGKIPRAFLRGCGVPDALIVNVPDLVSAQEAIQFYSCFISYSHKDEEFTNRLFSRMRDEKLRVWFAPEDMKSGNKIHEQIEDAIRIHDKLLLVLSDESMKSEWVKTEIAHARQREVKEGKRVLFPIRLLPFETIRDWKAFDADTGKDMAREIREYFIPDFSNWKDHDAFESGFKRLLGDLRATAGVAT